MVFVNRQYTNDFRIVNGDFIHIYFSTGTQNIEIIEGGNVQVLVVAGGGSGGLAASAYSAGGGGGGGEVAYVASFPVTQGIMSITVGAGGVNSNGGNSIFGSIQTNGGGRGGTEGTIASTGGSGGGAGRNFLTAAASVKLYAGGLGNAGGIGITGVSGAAGGGGAGGVGGNVPDGTFGGVGAAGYTSSISAIASVYGSGGGGGARGGGDNAGGNGGTNAGKGGGCETASTTAINGRNATNGFGGGGGGAGGGGGVAPANVGVPGNGGSGIIIVRYPAPLLQLSGEMKFAKLRSTYSISTTYSSNISLKQLHGWTGTPSNSVLTGPISVSNFYGKSAGIVAYPFDETGLTATYPAVTMPGGSGTIHTLSSVYNYQISGLAGWSAVRYMSNGTQVQVQNYGNLRTNENISTSLAKVLSFLKSTGRTVTLYINYAIIVNTIYANTNNGKTLRIILTVNGVSTVLYENGGAQTTQTRQFDITSYLGDATSFSINLHFNLYNSGTTTLDNNRLDVNRIYILVSSTLSPLT